MNTLHISIAAQSDNLGDVEIRRLFIEQFVQRGYNLVVFTGRMPNEYIDAFRLPADAKLLSKPMSFQLATLQNALRGRASLAYAPGPHILVDSPKAIAKAASVLALCAVVRLRGGSLSVIGRSLRGSGRVAVALERALSSLATSYAMRDSASSAILGRSVKVLPDMAFLRSTTSPEDSNAGKRDIIALSFRSDREISPEGLSILVSECRALDLEPVLLTQVRRDDERHAELAKLLGIKAVLWEGRTHAQQEALIEKYYSRSHAVISNRLHSLLFGMASGAFPVGLREAGQDKIRTTLAPWIHFDVLNVDDPDFAFLERTEAEREQLVHCARAARTILEDFISEKIQNCS